LLRLAKAGVNIVTAHVIKCQLKRDQERHQGLFHIIKQPVIMATGREKMNRTGSEMTKCAWSDDM